MDFSANQSLEAITAGMSHAALGKLILDYIDALPPAQLQAAMHDRAAETLAEIYDILEDPDLDAPTPCRKLKRLYRPISPTWGCAASGTRSRTEKSGQRSGFPLLCPDFLFPGKGFGRGDKFPEQGMRFVGPGERRTLSAFSRLI